MEHFRETIAGDVAIVSMPVRLIEERVRRICTALQDGVSVPTDVGMGALLAPSCGGA